MIVLKVIMYVLYIAVMFCGAYALGVFLAKPKETIRFIKELYSDERDS